MATYSIATTALALTVDRKHVENLLGRYRFPGTTPGRQGKSRRLRHETIVALAAVLELDEALGIGWAAAAGVLQRLSEQRAGGATATVKNGAVSVSVDFAELERNVRARLAEALEIAPRPNRGRPRSRRKERN